LQLEEIGYEESALEMLARSGSGSLRDTLTLLDQAIIYSKNYVNTQTVTDMLGLVDPQFLETVFTAIFEHDRATLLEKLKALEEYEAEMVVDEMIAYLKERLYESDSRYSTLLIERFFRILSDSKSLFSINADGGFVLSMVLFKMIESLKVKEIDQMIESLEAQIDVHAPVLKSAPSPITKEKPTQTEPTLNRVPQAPSEITPPTQEQETTVVPTTETPSAPATEQPTVPPQSTAVSDVQERALFEKLIAKIEDRSVELGSCFKNQIHFVSYVDETLTWESCADEACKKQLKHGYSVIKQFVREIFGFETKIKAQKCSKESPQRLTPKPDFHDEQALEQSDFSSFESAPPQASSMTEEAEVGVGSCVAPADSNNDQSTKEFDGQAILDEPMIQKATELFEATKITIQNKV